MNRRTGVFVLALVCALPLAGCAAGGGQGDPQAVAPAEGWTFSAPAHAGLWYHGLALAGAGADSAPVLPLYRPDHADDVARAGRGAGGPDFVALGRDLTLSGADHGAQFLPLYFGDWASLLEAVQLWERAGGDPRRAQSQETAQVIAFLSAQFSTADQRRAVLRFVQALEQERSFFFDRHWSASAPLQAVRAVEDRWRELRPRLVHFLRYTDFDRGRGAAVPALGPEGRALTTLQPTRVAFGLRPGESADVAVVRLIHEAGYALAAEAVRDHVAPAEIRRLGEATLVGRAAVRAGAMVVERLLPELTPDYRRYYTSVVGESSSRFEQAFPLPDELRAGLVEAIDLATAGI